MLKWSVLCLLLAYATAELVLVPSIITSTHIRMSTIEVHLWFTDNDTMSSISTVTTPATEYSIPESIASPRGVGAFWDSLCTFPCVKIINSSLAVLTLNQEAEFDTLQTEWVFISFDRLLFSDRTARLFRLPVSADEWQSSGGAFGLGALFQIATIAHSLTMPMMIDAQVVALFAQQPCMTIEQNEWIPSAPYLSFLMAGESVFDLSWRVVVMVGSIVFISVCAIALFPTFFKSKIIIRAVLPLLLIQIVCLWFPSLTFASTYLVSYGLASYQTWGAFLFCGMIGLGVIAVLQVFADQTLTFIQYPIVKAYHAPSIQHRIWKRLTGIRGWWLAPRYCIMYQSGDVWYLRHMNRVLLPYYFDGKSKVQHMTFIGINVLLVAGTGIQARTPDGCFIQGCCIVGFLFVSSFGLLAITFNSNTVKGLTCLVRLMTSSQLVGLVAFPTKDFHTLFQVVTSLNIVLLIARCAVIVGTAYREGLSTVCTEPVEENLKLHPLIAVEDDAHRPSAASPLRLPSPESYEPPPSNFNFLNIKQDLPMQQDYSDSDQSYEDEALEMENKPSWITGASPVKPKAQKSDYLAAPAPTWYPTDRSNVRTTNDADRELDVTPFTIRTTRKPPPL
eukprot:GILI01028003.1.p1 GENE.GILI01028003.1~~GILI01028003.1.p1  ORF type:complete len:618 (+),score=42.85 GILI01028003.1:86-1939(+)